MTAPSAKPTASSRPLDLLDPSSTGSPPNLATPENLLNESIITADNPSGNPTDAVNDGLGDITNGVVEGRANEAGTKDFYYMYLQKFCSGTLTSEDDGNADGVKVDDCSSWGDAGDSKGSPAKSIELD